MRRRPRCFGHANGMANCEECVVLATPVACPYSGEMTSVLRLIKGCPHHGAVFMHDTGMEKYFENSCLK